MNLILVLLKQFTNKKMMGYFKLKLDKIFTLILTWFVFASPLENNK